jgi:predicted  nucleic acid-binding Zn-ribbon protein
MKKDSAFKLKSGNKPSIAKMFGMMKTMKKNMQTAKDNRSKRDMSKAPKAMQNLNKAIGDALGSTGNLRKKISDKITSKKSKTFKGKKGDPYTYRKTKDGGYEYSKDGKKFTKATNKKAIEAISKIAPK